MLPDCAVFQESRQLSPVAKTNALIRSEIDLCKEAPILPNPVATVARS